MSKKPIATITDRDAMKDVEINVTVTFKRTLRWRAGYWILQAATRIAALLMGCDIRVGKDEENAS